MPSRQMAAQYQLKGGTFVAYNEGDQQGDIIDQGTITFSFPLCHCLFGFVFWHSRAHIHRLCIHPRIVRLFVLHLLWYTPPSLGSTSSFCHCQAKKT